MRVAVRILHADSGGDCGHLARLLDTIRAGLARRHADTFGSSGADDVRVITGGRDGRSFGRRLSEVLADAAGQGGPFGLVVLGSGSVPLIRPDDAQRFVQAAASNERLALANNAFSADIVAIARADALPEAPDLPSDNALPRWLAEHAGWAVHDMRRVRRLAFDIDSPVDAALVGLFPAEAQAAFEAVVVRAAALAALAHHPRAELVLAGRTSAATLAILERKTRCRVRAIVEERGLRASSALAIGPAAATFGGRPAHGDTGADRFPVRRPRSLLGLLLDRDGPAALGSILAELGDGAIVDTRVLLAHRLGADESAWPGPDDRFASDLLDAASVSDRWLRDLTAAAAAAPIPILLGGHSLVGPGIGFALGIERAPADLARAGVVATPDARAAPAATRVVNGSAIG